MGFLIGFLVVVMLLDCAFLILLVLVQLPKKEAGAGLAFGGAAADALLGAGSGTTLTKITRWAATVFFGLAIFLAILMNHYYRPGSTRLESKLSQPQPEAAAPAPAPSAAPSASTPATPTSVNTNFIFATTTNAPLLSTTNAAPVQTSNAPAASTTNAAPAPK